MMMTNKEKYKQAFSVLHASNNISLEVNKDMNRKKVFNPSRKLATACMCAALMMGTGLTVYAAYHFLTPSQVASEMYESSSIADAFEGENAIQINESAESNGYVITLLGITSGTGLNKYFDDDGNQIEKNETYAVIAIENSDGTAMPDTSDANYDMNNVLVTPFIGGQEPWKINIYTLDGGYTEITRDGIVYRLISCKNLDMFADRGVYVGVCEKISDIKEAYTLNSETGSIEANNDFDGLNVLFRLPLNESSANKDEADQVLDQILNPTEDDSSSSESYEETDFDLATPKDLTEWNKLLEMGMPGNDVARLCHVVDGSETVVKANEKGEYNYYKEGDLSASFAGEYMGPNGEIQVISWSSNDTLDSLKILTYVYNNDGTVTFAIYTPNN